MKMRGRKKKKLTTKKSHLAETDSAADEDFEEIDIMPVSDAEDGAEWQFLDVVCIFLKLILGFFIENYSRKMG
jgi:hypothetical protein